MTHTIITLIPLICFACVVQCDPVSNTTVSSSTTTTASPFACEDYNGDCGACVKHGSCLYCNEGKQCLDYPSGKLLPSKSLCPLSKARWGTCVVNYEALLIAMGVLAGILLISGCCCVYCCCCRKKNNRKKWADQEAKQERETQEREARHAERRAERQGRLDEIRRKYGLVKEDNPYQRFDA